MLNNAKEGEKIGLEGDVYDQVAAACRGARPKIQKWIEDDDGEKEGLMGEEPDVGIFKPPLTLQIACCFAMTSSIMLWRGSRRANRETGPRRNQSSRRKPACAI